MNHVGATELAVIQTAVDALMADLNLSAIPHPIGSVSGTRCVGQTNDMRAFPDATNLTSKQAADFLRFRTSGFHYVIASNGRVYQCDSTGTLLK